MPTALLKQSKGLRFLTLRRRGRPLSEIASAAGWADACVFLRFEEPCSSPPPPRGGLLSHSRRRRRTASNPRNGRQRNAVRMTVRAAASARGGPQRHSHRCVPRRLPPEQLRHAAADGELRSLPSVTRPTGRTRDVRRRTRPSSATGSRRSAQRPCRAPRCR